MNSFDVIKAEGIASQTNKGRAYELYGHTEWLRCILYLNELNVTTDGILFIMNSKHMIWSTRVHKRVFVVSDEDSPSVNNFKNYINLGFNGITHIIAKYQKVLA